MPTLTRDVAIDAVRDFFRDKPCVFFGTGMSCALDTRFGMASLQDALRASIAPADTTQGEQWARVLADLSAGVDLESALNHVSHPELLGAVNRTAGSHIAAIDREYAFRIAGDEVLWPPIQLVRRLVDTLPEGDPILHVLTPNYDLLCEHACDAAGVLYTTGFCGGIERKASWGQIDRCLVSCNRVSLNGRLKLVCRQRKHIRLHKVHGSLNYFFHRNAVVQNDAWAWSPPEYAERVIITPGLPKYEKLQLFRQELLRSADDAIERATQFLFLGYGFNDKHLEEYIKRKLVTQGCRGLIITRDSNSRIEALLKDAANLWLLCRSENGTEGTRIFNAAYPDWLVLPNERLWQVQEFSNQVLGA